MPWRGARNLWKVPVTSVAAAVAVPLVLLSLFGIGAGVFVYKNGPPKFFRVPRYSATKGGDRMSEISKRRSEFAAATSKEGAIVVMDNGPMI